MARILVIDDDPSLRRSMRKVLERSGHEVIEAEDGDKGMRLVREVHPDLVVTDLLMPEKEGIETIQELRAEFPEIPIVAVSGAGSVEEGGPLLDAQLFGADATLSKPFEVEELVQTVTRVLAGKG
jgi:two-component system, chemotaxis family, chemotaxis protein CheY